MKVFIGAEPGGPKLGYIFPFAMMLNKYLQSKGHYTTFDFNESVDIALCVAFKPNFEQVKALKKRGAKIVHRLDGRVRSIVKLYDRDEEVRKINKIADWTIFQSDFVKKHTTLPVQTIFGVEDPICTNVENSSVVFNGVDRNIFNEAGERIPLKGKVNILHVAITAGIRKGAKYVLKIAEYLRGNSDYHFYLIGNQDKDLSCGHLISEGVYKNVTHLGPILDQCLLAKYMRSSQILLFPSVDDYCPNTVIEAMSCGLPIWYHNSGGTPELIKRGRHLCGVPITPENDIQPLQVLSDELEFYGKEAVSIVKENFTSEIIGKKYVDLFLRLMASPSVSFHDKQDPLAVVYFSKPERKNSSKKRPREERKLIYSAKKIISGAVFWTTQLYLKLIGESPFSGLLKIWVKTRDVNSNFAPGSAAGRRALKFWFEAQQYIDVRINEYCALYYDDKHPKHHLWLGHNRYLYDSVRVGDRVLDIGCGASYYQQWIAEKAAVIVGVDLLPERVEMARRQNTKSNVRYELKDVTRDIPDDQFDVVLCSHVLEHLDEPAAVLRSLAEKVPKLIVKVPLIDSHWMKLVKQDIGMFWKDDGDHRREYTENSLKEELEESGWRVVEMIRGYDLRATAVSVVFRKDMNLLRRA